ncbi:MAG TPA: alpha/beta hydrolase, partial [Bacteroidia bacterium]|nr:alpha/beta hydrolase [Bacteroidia bacterium]
GDDDKIVPVDISANKTIKLIKSAELKIYKGAPHGLYLTEKDKLNDDLLRFMGVKTKIQAMA